MKWGTPQPIVVKNPGVGLGIALLQAFGTYSFFVSNPQQFVAQVVGAQGAYTIQDIQGRFRTMLLSKLADLLGELGTKGGKSVLDLIGLTEEVGAGVRAKGQEDFKALGVTLKSFYVESIKPSEKSAEELRAMGLLDMATYTQLQAADAMREAARNPSGGAGLTAGIGAGIGIGNIMGQALQGGMTNTMQGGPQAPAGGGAGAAAAPDIMSPAEAANYLKVSEADVMQMVNEGALKAKKIGSQFRISRSALDDFLKS
jgi:excisionase family DNA binding protein